VWLRNSLPFCISIKSMKCRVTPPLAAFTAVFGSSTRFKLAERNTSECYLQLLPLLTQPGRVRLLHDHALRYQLAGLERRVHAGDRESVSHANVASAHDDVAAAAAGAIFLPSV
jgi:hypothetical protein